MSFVIDAIKLNNFRNYSNLEFSPGENLTIIIGDNATGKTNTIEAIQLLTMGESFRNPQWEDVLMWGELKAEISMFVTDGKRELSVKAAFENNKRKYSINGKEKSLKDIKGRIPAVLFVPDDLRIIKDSSERRRALLDSVGVQLSPSYGKLKNDFEKIVRQRNNLLKEETISSSLLESWTESLIGIGALYYDQRVKLFNRIKEKYLSVYPFLIKERVDLEYIPSWGKYHLDDDSSEENMRALSVLVQAEEKRRKVTLFGPHKDEINFYIEGKDVRQFGSQGQQRVVILVWKLAEIEVIKEISGQTPVLLLDDVMSELDSQKREAFISYVQNKAQTFITTTNKEYFSKAVLDNATIIRT